MAERQRRDTVTAKLAAALAAIQEDEQLAADELVVAARSALQEVLEQQQLEEPAAVAQLAQMSSRVAAHACPPNQPSAAPKLS